MTRWISCTIDLAIASACGRNSRASLRGIRDQSRRDRPTPAARPSSGAALGPGGTGAVNSRYGPGFLPSECVVPRSIVMFTPGGNKIDVFVVEAERDFVAKAT
jgi:hypothetical protein